MADQDKIHQIVQNSDYMKRFEAIEQLRDTFVILPDKKQATKDLLVLVNDENCGLRGYAAHILGSVFPHLTDKEQA